MIYWGNEKKLFTNQTKTFVFMKKFNYLFGWLFCGAALLGFGCDDDKTDAPPRRLRLKSRRRKPRLIPFL